MFYSHDFIQYSNVKYIFSYAKHTISTYGGIEVVDKKDLLFCSVFYFQSDHN